MSYTILVINVESWFAPDPAEQFSNPYLAMGNNPVMYVDPDGEFILPALIIAGFIAGSMGTAAIADNRGIDISGRDILLGGFKGAAIGAMVASGVGAVAAKTVASKAVAAETVATKVVSQKALMAKAGLKSGTINAVSNYDFESGLSDFGLGTFADFGAGFAGGAFGVGAGSKLAGMFVGGVLNTAVNTELGDGGYEHAQAFAGGALSVYAGTGKYLKGKKLASKPFWKGAETFGKYGIQGTAYDFAYTDEKYFTKRTGWEHAGLFAVGGAAGVSDGMFFSGDAIQNKFARVGVGLGIYATEWTVSSRLKQGAYGRYNGYPPGGFYTGRSQTAKGWILGGKWYEQYWNIFNK